MSILLIDRPIVGFIDDFLYRHKGQIALLRVDCNVPLKDGLVADDARILAILPTLELLLQNNNKIIIISHLGRPRGHDSALSLAPIVQRLRQLVPSDVSVSLSNSYDASGVRAQLQAFERCILILENLRFHLEEELNDDNFAKKLASLSDFYVNDAFACAHRAHASVDAITTFLPSYAGLLMKRELLSVGDILGAKRRPSMAIIGGAKISTKVALIENLLNMMDRVVVGGGIANYILRELGHNIGDSLLEKNIGGDIKNRVDGIMRNPSLLLPRDVVVTRNYMTESPEHRTVSTGSVVSSDIIVDVGPETIQSLASELRLCKFVFWNGPLGLFEHKPFDQGSVMVAQLIANLTRECTLHSLIGGGETIQLLRSNALLGSFSFVSTGGGALLELLSGCALPGLLALRKNKVNKVN